MQSLAITLHERNNAFMAQLKASLLDVQELMATRHYTIRQAELLLEDAEAYLQQAYCKVYPVGEEAYMLQLMYLSEAQAPCTLQLQTVEFLPPYFDQFDIKQIIEAAPFRFDYSHTHQFAICARSQELLACLNQLSGLQLTDALQGLELATQLLRRAIELIAVPFTACTVPACRFLNSEAEREKIFEARRILEESIGNPISIKDLARKVAINECYLKKGFKTLVGKTVHEYQQQLRIDAAKKMLAEQQLSVTEVSALLGFSSIAHFSTAFKRLTGMKPCELLR